jgi:hypothetical protein
MATRRRREPMSAERWTSNMIRILVVDMDKWSDDDCKVVEQILWKAAGLVRKENNHRAKYGPLALVD